MGDYLPPTQIRVKSVCFEKKQKNIFRNLTIMDDVIRKLMMMSGKCILLYFERVYEVYVYIYMYMYIYIYIV